MVIEALSVLLNKAVAMGLCNGIEIRNNTLVVSHLQYAKNTMIFCKPELDIVLNIKKMLRCFQGSKLTFAKADFMA